MSMKHLIFLASVVSTLLFSGCTHQPMGRSVQGWDHMMGYGGYGGMFMWLIWILVAGVIIYFVFDRIKNSNKTNSPVSESHVDILKKRYAKGEISKQEFDELKNELKD